MKKNKKYCIIRGFSEGDIDIDITSGLDYDQLMEELMEDFFDEYDNDELAEMSDKKLSKVIDEWEESLSEGDCYCRCTEIYEVDLKTGELIDSWVKKEDQIKYIRDFVKNNEEEDEE